MSDEPPSGAYTPPDALLGDDPRITADTLRYLESTPTAHETVLVGVAHDHPASKYRAATIVDRIAPNTLALELSAAAVPLFRQYAATSETPPPRGGEMSAAIQAADTAQVVGIDRLDRRFLVALAQRLVHHRGQVSGTMLRTLARGLGSFLWSSGHCFVAGLAARVAGRPPSVTTAHRFEASYDCTVDDPPAVQAENEAEAMTRSLSVLNTFDPPLATQVNTATREELMAARIQSYRQSGSVVAIIGRAHLDDVVAQVAAHSD